MARENLVSLVLRQSRVAIILIHFVKRNTSNKSITNKKGQRKKEIYVFPGQHFKKIRECNKHNKDNKNNILRMHSHKDKEKK